jgi:hypothetical protein
LILEFDAGSKSNPNAEGRISYLLPYQAAGAAIQALEGKAPQRKRNFPPAI